MYKILSDCYWAPNSAYSNFVYTEYPCSLARKIGANILDRDDQYPLKEDLFVLFLELLRTENE